MTNTLATRKQSQTIRNRMQAIRSEMPYDADSARAQLQDLTDWKYHMRKRPWPILASVTIAAYFLVPRKRDQRVIVHSTSSSSPEKPAAKKGMLGGIVGALMTLAIKQGTSMAARQVSQAFYSHRPSTTPGESYSSPTYSDNTSL